MNEDILFLKTLVGLGGSGLIVFLTQLFKPFIPETKWYPFIAIGFGLLINIAIALVIKPVTAISLLVAIVLGIMAGGASGGWYSGGSTLREGPESNKNNRPTIPSTTSSGENRSPPG